MGLFSKKSDEQKEAENKVDELCGGFLGNDRFKTFLKKNNLDETTANTFYKNILKNEINNGTLDYEDLEIRLDELMKLDVVALYKKIYQKHNMDTSLFKTQHDINEFLGSEYAEKYGKSRQKAEMKHMKNLEKDWSKVKKLEEKFNIDLTGKTWFECSIEEIKYSTFQNQPQRNIDTAYVIINSDNVEILKESVWIKSNMGTRKIFFDNITSIDYDARGMFHASSSLIINTKSAEHIHLKFVGENNYNLLNNAFENYIRKPHDTTFISQSSNADDLVKYAELYEKGLISEDEFNIMKNKIIHDESNSGFDEEPSLDYMEKNNAFCPNCGCEVEYDAKFCSSCGNKLN